MAEIQFSTISKVCEQCQTEFPFDPARPNKRFCKPACRKVAEDAKRISDKNAARTSNRKANVTKFIGVDGEGVDIHVLHDVWDEQLEEWVLTRVRSHSYVLLSVGDKSFHKNGEELTHEDVFSFLYEQKLANPDAAFVGFFLGYDFSQWFKTLPESRAFLLFHKDGIAQRMPRNTEMKFPFPVYYKRWEFDMLGMKRFKLRPRVAKADWPQCTKNHKTAELIDECASGKHNRHPYAWMYICDAGSFFQTSLMNAINRKKWLPGTEVVTEEEERILQAGKDNRSHAKFDETMIEYNILENDVLARLMKTVNEGFIADGIKLNTNQWFGPGQAAQAWMRLIGLPTGDEVRNVVPAWAIESARQSYYGGWFEIMMHGPVPGKTYCYDINSAYPYAISKLPCLLHGEWIRGEGKPPKLPRGAYQLIDARVVGNDQYIGAMPHRDSDGRIVRPQKTAGWYWQSEIDAARKAGLIRQVFIDSWARYIPCDCPPPARAIAELYESRLRVNKDSPYGKSKKLVYNSAYGKFAQSVGQPRFSNSIYASLITSTCRSMILEAIATHPRGTAGVAMVATDSVTFTEPHPTLDIDKEALGKWGADTYENLSLMMPGLYWDDSSRETIRQGKTPSLKSRGVSARDLAQFINQIDAQWARLSQREFFSTEEAPEVDINVAFSVISPKLAMHRDRWEQCGLVQWNTNRRLSADMNSKRLACRIEYLPDGRKVIRSAVWDDIPDEPRSYPYSKTFGAVLDDELRHAEELLTPDGTIAAQYLSVLPGR